MSIMRSLPFLLALSLLSAPALAQTHQTILLWPNGNPEPTKVTGPERDPTTDANRMYAGKLTVRITDVSQPSLTVYPTPAATNTGAAVLVFPGGGYDHLAWNMEGIEVCDWLNSIGITGVLVKYRVPENGHYPANTEDLEDAQQAMRITRAHAVEWHIDPKKVGVIGFSAGAHLAVVISTHPEFQSPNVPASTIDTRPNFQLVMYPAYLLGSSSQGLAGKVDPAVQPDDKTPPTFLVMAENDHTAHVETALVYYQALKDAQIPAELHLYTQGGHGFGLRPTDLPISHWPAVAEIWLHTIHILGPPAPVGRP
jgi:acetyl esterase/lipase